QSCTLTKGGSGVDATLLCALVHRCDPAGRVTAVTIGDDVIVGAGSIVTRSVPAGATAPIGPCPGDTTVFDVSIATFSSSCRDQNSFDGHGHCLCRLALDRPRVVDIELDNLAGRGRSGHQRHAL